MHDPEPNDLQGKAKRVIGMFTAMLGSGIILESPAFWTGTVFTLAGLGVFIWGHAELRSSLSASRDAAGPTLSAGPSEKGL